jgi:hypothetical protein
MHRNKVVEAANPGCRSHSRSGSPGEAEAVSGRFEALDMTDFSFVEPSSSHMAPKPLGNTVLFRSIRVRFGIFDTIKIQKKSDKLRKNYYCNKKKWV